ncbi:ATP-binding protein [Novosphingobium mathurense]|uniref:histidine kinase n=1 Tax=Novosphingobium mathurense TaxID=428990 RepID=A0A1U6GS45_9SPHN|nr:ATP-binding protein [Novosphingobium mathurense]SLJ86304.1 PAS domain S-box-containing protein [Novosphingobium mathurense]
MKASLSASVAARRESWRQRIAKIIALIVPLLIGGVALLLQEQVQTTDRLAAAEAETQEKRNLILSVFSAHQDIETGGRGYVLTGDPEFLQPFDKGTRELGRIEPALRRAFAGQPEDLTELAAISELSHDKREFTDRIISLQQAGDNAGAVALIRNKGGKRLMDGIRSHITSLLKRENDRLTEVSARSQQAISALRQVTFSLLFLLLALLIIAGIAILRTLRAREQALIQLEDVSLRRQAVLENAMDGILTLNPSGSIETTNAATTRLFGYREVELDRRDVGMLFASQPAIGEFARELREMHLSSDGAGTAREIVGRRKDGTEFPIEIALSAMVLNEGLRYVAVIRDITERKRVEQLKSEFVSTVSHELRTPLTSIAGSLGLLSGGAAGELGERAGRLISIAQSNANRLVRLINDILDIEKMESGRMPFHNSELDLSAALATSIEENRSFSDGYGVKLALQAPQVPVWVRADADRLAQVFANLMSNAIKFSPNGGTVSVTVSPGARYHRVSFTDEGHGIPEEFRSRIFGKFAQADSSDTRQKGGTGLGLSIVREIVQRLGGKVSFDSQLNKGTSFHVDLPALHDGPGRGTPGQEAGLLVCGNGAASAFTEALRRAGYTVSLVGNVQAVRAALASSNYDGIVVDMGLSVGAGIEIIRMVRETARHSGTPILALGGKTGSRELEGDAALVLDWLRKPIEVGRLIDSVDAASRVLDGARPRILHLEDDPDIARIVTEALDGRANVVAVDSLAAARRELASNRFDLAILDLTLTDGDGSALLPDLRRDGEPLLPVVIFSAQDADPETAGSVDACLTKARTPIGALVAIVESLTSPTRTQETVA